MHQEEAACGALREGALDPFGGAVDQLIATLSESPASEIRPYMLIQVEVIAVEPVEGAMRVAERLIVMDVLVVKYRSYYCCSK